MNLIFSILSILVISCNTIDPCKRNIKQPWDETGYKVYHFDGLGYVVGKYERQAIPSEDGTIHWPDTKYMTVFVRLVWDSRLNVYYPFPENQGGSYNTIWEKDSCAAKAHWFKYEKQWKR